MSEESKLRKLLRLLLVGSGATMVVSAIAGIVSAYALIEPSDAEAVGITPSDFVGYYALMILIGASMTYFGLRRKKK